MGRAARHPAATPPRLVAPAVLVAGAVLLLVLREGLGLSPDWTPVLVGVPALLAGVAGRRANLVAAGLAVTAFGLAVLAVRVGPLPAAREAPALVVAVAAGFLLAAVATRAMGRPGDVAVAGLAALTTGIAFWFAFDMAAVLSAWVWSAALLAWAAAEALLSPRPER
ncbi:hypothetical protein BH23ACT8_BH23ACT8_25470 [soil metagenome]